MKSCGSTVYSLVVGELNILAVGGRSAMLSFNMPDIVAVSSRVEQRQKAGAVAIRISQNMDS